MKFCQKCGKEVSGGDRYCINCGEKLVNDTKTKRKEGLGTASLVLGIISLVLSFTLNIIIFPIALIGLILGIVNKAHHGKKIAGIILNAISMVVSIVVFIIFVIILSYGIFEYVDSAIFNDDNNSYSGYVYSNNSVIGTWNCKDVSDMFGNDNNYLKTVKIDSDNTFVLGDYGNLYNDSVRGTYEKSSDTSKTFMNRYIYTSIEMDANEKYVSGIKTEDIDDDYTMVFTKNKKNSNYVAFLVEEDSDSVYYCNK